MNKIITCLLLVSSMSLNNLFASGIEKKIKEIAGSNGIKNAQWSISVKYADSGKEIVSLNPRKNLIPGSILKLFVTAAALEYLGPEYRFKTGIYYEGKISKGVLNGNIYIVGGGDPSLGSNFVRGALPMEQVFEDWTKKLKALGIVKINGNIIIDETLFDGMTIPGDWSWEDVGNYYAAQPSALTINDNLYKLYFKPGAKAGDDARILRMEPQIYGLEFINFMKTGPRDSGDNGYIFNFPQTYMAVLRGTIPQNGQEFAIKGSIPDPGMFCARSFEEHLKKTGIKVTGKSEKVRNKISYDDKKLVSETYSPPLKNIIYVANKRSFNLFAEILLRHLAVYKNRPATIENGISALKEFLSSNGVDTSEMKLSDASGLSRLNMVKAGNFTDLLLRVHKKKFFRVYYDSLIYPGDPDGFGHIKNFGAGTYLEKNLRIKSGSLNGVRGYCGYFRTKKGRPLVFAFIINNYSIAPVELDRIHKSLLLEIASKY